ncbi:hypothetical protein OAE80_03820 [Planctomycetaceae bacterium]|nr:hypothetical protein [Planctomycetaceae bacterium]
MFLSIAFLLTDASQIEAQPPVIPMLDNPRAVVSHWLELHRTGKPKAAAALTTGSRDHRARYLLPSTRDTGVRTERSLGNKRVAAVVTSSLKKTGEEVVLFWLVRREGVWRIKKSDKFKRQIVDERLRGFLEAGDVHWHVPRADLLGNWESGPCNPPTVGWIACGSRLKLNPNNRYRLEAWGPGGPALEDDDDIVMQGNWRLADDKILLSHEDRTYSYRVTWLADILLTVECSDEMGRSQYERSDVARD